jgi:hypothetical protein
VRDATGGGSGRSGFAGALKISGDEGLEGGSREGPLEDGYEVGGNADLLAWRCRTRGSGDFWPDVVPDPEATFVCAEGPDAEFVPRALSRSIWAIIALCSCIKLSSTVAFIGPPLDTRRISLSCANPCSNSSCARALIEADSS